jgi:hypothetical protein
MDQRNWPLSKIIEERRTHKETLGVFWALNPERDKLRRELPFIAAALDYCARDVGEDRIKEMQQQEVERERSREAARIRATRSNNLRKRTLNRTLQLKKVDRKIDGETMEC